MRILEFEAKALLKNQGMRVPRGEVVTSGAAAGEAARNLGGPVVLKAQIPSGRRMKSGAVLFTSTPDEATKAAGLLLGRTINNFVVERVLVEERISFQQEIYLAATYDSIQKSAILIASASGGIEIESAETVIRKKFSMRSPVPGFLGRELAADLGFQGPDVTALGKIVTQVANGFVHWDAVLLEINPLVRNAKGEWWVADAHLELDDDAVFRQGEILREIPFSREFAARRSEIASRAAQIDSKDHRGVAGRLVAFDGDLGLLVGGGGASLATMDALLDAGLHPANYCEIGGNPSVWKVKELTKLILGLPRVQKIAVIMNVVSNTRVDLVARGVIKGVLESGRQPSETIVGFRVPGSWEAEGQAILNHYSVRSFGRETSIDQMVDAIQCQS